MPLRVTQNSRHQISGDAHGVRYRLDCRRSCSQGQRPFRVAYRVSKTYAYLGRKEGVAASGVSSRAGTAMASAVVPAQIAPPAGVKKSDTGGGACPKYRPGSIFPLRRPRPAGNRPKGDNRPSRDLRRALQQMFTTPALKTPAQGRGHWCAHERSEPMREFCAGAQTGCQQGQGQVAQAWQVPVPPRQMVDRRDLSG